MKNNVFETSENKCEVSFRSGKYLCKVFVKEKLWSVFETNLKGLKKIIQMCKKKDYRKFNMI